MLVVRLIDNEDNKTLTEIKVENISEALKIINQIEVFTINEKEYKVEKNNICYKCYYNMDENLVNVFMEEV